VSTTLTSPPESGPEAPSKRGDRTLGARRARIPYVLAAPGIAWLGLFFLVPLALMLIESLKTGGLFSGGYHFNWEFSNYSDAITKNWEYIFRSIRISAYVTVACLLFGYPLAYWIAFHGGRWKSQLLLLVLLPFFVSYIIRTIQWTFMLSDEGIILGPLKSIGLLPQSYHVLATEFAVVAGIFYSFLPFAMLPLYVSLERIDKRLVEAATDLYSSRVQAFLKVVLPLSLPGVFAAVVLTFVPATGDYVNAELLGNPGTFMVGNKIQDLFLNKNNYPEAAALSLVLMVVMVVIASIYARALGTEEATNMAAAG
jgi:spermidine/putrescine transport system permease protein